MSKSRQKLGWLVLIGGAAIAFVAALGVGRLHDAEPSSSASRAAPAAAPETSPRFKVPVSMSQPTIGADDAYVTIVEWGDFRTAAARHARDVLNGLRSKFGDKLRVVHRQLPTPTDPESMLINYFARGAFDVGGKFWEVRDRLLDFPEDVPLTSEQLRVIADEVGFDFATVEKGIEHKDFARYIGVDVLFAGKFGVDHTPAFFVNGRRLPAVDSGELASALEGLIAAELVHAQALERSGVERGKLYDAIIEDGLWSTDDDPAARKAARVLTTAAPQER